jgi:hypothetical protein
MKDAPAHTLDEVIGDRPRTAEEIAADLAKSPAFLSAVGRAVAEASRECGHGFSARVRQALGHDLLDGRIEE